MLGWDRRAISPRHRPKSDGVYDLRGRLKTLPTEGTRARRPGQGVYVDLSMARFVVPPE